MAWPEHHLRDWAHFTDIAEHLNIASPFQGAYLFRGQAVSSWDLQPGLLRALGGRQPAAEAIWIEQRSVKEFCRQAHLYLGDTGLPRQDQPLEWLALMQHHGSPTRLLDWTRSPFVAAYFAAVERWDEDGAIWLVHAQTIEKSLGAVSAASPLTVDLSDPSAPSLVWVYSPDRMSPRMIAQQGAFTVSVNILADQETQIEACCKPHHKSPDEVYRKLIVPAKLKPAILRELRTMNVTANALFPGLDGLGRFVKEAVSLASAFPRR